MSRRRKSLAQGYGSGDLPRQEVRASLPDVQRTTPSGRYRDKKTYCRGKIGGEKHEDHLEVRRAPWSIGLSRPSCYRADWSSPYWSCNHETICTNCGKIISTGLGDQCPDFTTDITRWRRRD